MKVSLLICQELSNHQVFVFEIGSSMVNATVHHFKQVSLPYCIDSPSYNVLSITLDFSLFINLVWNQKSKLKNSIKISWIWTQLPHNDNPNSHKFVAKILALLAIVLIIELCFSKLVLLFFIHWAVFFTGHLNNTAFFSDLLAILMELENAGLLRLKMHKFRNLTDKTLNCIWISSLFCYSKQLLRYSASSTSSLFWHFKTPIFQVLVLLLSTQSTENLFHWNFVER